MRRLLPLLLALAIALPVAACGGDGASGSAAPIAPTKADLLPPTILGLKVEREETSNWGTPLYRNAPAERQVATARFVPYHLWDNRAPGEMLVWVQSDR